MLKVSKKLLAADAPVLVDIMKYIAADLYLRDLEAAKGT